MEYSLHHLVMVWEDAFLKALDFFERNNKVILVDPDADRLSVFSLCPLCIIRFLWGYRAGWTWPHCRWARSGATPCPAR